MSGGDAVEAETPTSTLWPVVLLEKQESPPKSSLPSGATLNIMFRSLMTKPLNFLLHVKSEKQN